MKKLIYFTWLLCSAIVNAQTADVNEFCGPNKPCDNGLYCVQVDREEFDYDYVCCECDQSKLAGYTAKVKEYCKDGVIRGIPENATFQEYMASDGRVAVDAFDKVMEMVKQCQEARLEREETCWDGGDPGHRDIIDQLKRQNTNLAAEKREWIEDQRVYYTTKSTYESMLSNFKYKCSSDRTEDIADVLEDMEDVLEDGRAIDCDKVEDYAEDCEKCQDAAADFLDDCFNDKIENMPTEYFTLFDNSGTVWKRAKDLLTRAKNDSLCD